MIRLLLTVEAGVALTVFALRYGDQWENLDVPAQITRVGLTGVLLYVLAGQVKAVDLNIPVDGYTYLGITALGLTNVGLLWTVTRRFRRPRG